ncbi:ataxin-2 homolog [Leptopilina heterotoma]|uniref:ataxin-2 homolog n=1 Tax=Leptopilina heterotoma TaxID=63436 RepID=UPI001CA9F2D0|nr:ataxin-2 homolog [Leptopilina heterotoma]
MKLFILMFAFAATCNAQLPFVDQNPEVYQQRTGLGQIRQVRQAQQQQQHALPNYRPYSQVPGQIKQLLQLQQAREPIVSVPAHVNPPQVTPGQTHQGAPQANVQTQSQATSYRPKIHFGSAPSQAIEPINVQRGQHRAPQPQAYAPQGQQQYAPPQQQAYRPQQQQQPIYNHQQQQQPHYSNNIPPEIQQLIHAQQNQQG